MSDNEKDSYQFADTDHSDSDGDIVEGTHGFVDVETNGFVDIEKNNDDADVVRTGKPSMCCFCFCDQRRATITFATIGIVVNTVLLILTIVAATTGVGVLTYAYDPCERIDDLLYNRDGLYDDEQGYPYSDDSCSGEDCLSKAARACEEGDTVAAMNYLTAPYRLDLALGLFAAAWAVGIVFFSLMCVGAKRFSKCAMGWVVVGVVVHGCLALVFANWSVASSGLAHPAEYVLFSILVVVSYAFFLQPAVGLLCNLRSGRISKETYEPRCCELY